MKLTCYCIATKSFTNAIFIKICCLFLKNNVNSSVTFDLNKFRKNDSGYYIFKKTLKSPLRQTLLALHGYSEAKVTKIRDLVPDRSMVVFKKLQKLHIFVDRISNLKWHISDFGM